MKKASPQPEPSLQSVPELKTSMEPELLLDPVPEQILEIQIELEAVFVAEPVPKPEPEVVSEPDLALECEFASSSDLSPAPVLSIKTPLLHEYLDPFLIKDPDATLFQLSIEELVSWRFIFPSSSSSVFRSVAMGIHHQLVESHLCRLQQLTSRRGYFHQRRLMGIGHGNPAFMPLF